MQKSDVAIRIRVGLICVTAVALSLFAGAASAAIECAALQRAVNLGAANGPAKFAWAATACPATPAAATADDASPAPLTDDRSGAVELTGAALIADDVRRAQSPLAQLLRLQEAGGMRPGAALTGPSVLVTDAVPMRVSMASTSTSLALNRAIQWNPQIVAVARAHDIDPLLLHAIVHVESRYNFQAVSPAGARGLMQVMPTTGRRFGLSDPLAQLHDPAVNLRIGAAYLKTLQGIFGNDLPLVLAAYNAGEGAVLRYGSTIPPFRETQGYVRDVLAQYGTLRRLSSPRY